MMKAKASDALMMLFLSICTMAFRLRSMEK